MKDNGKPKGGTLLHDDYGVYADYLVKYLQGMNARGIPITTLTVQNEPENPKNTPSMVLTAEQEAEFIGRYLGPAMRAGRICTRRSLHSITTVITRSTQSLC